MAIRMRYGLESQFDPSKMVVGEWAVSTDTRYVRMCFSPGIVLRMATYDAFEADMAKIKAILAECRDIQTAITRIQSEVNAKAVLCAEYAESAKESADAAAESANKAKMYAENASAVTGVQIATEDIAGLVKGGDNHIAEDGTLTLTARTNTGLLEHSKAGGIRLHSISAVEDKQDGEPSPGEKVVISNNHLKITAEAQTTNGLVVSRPTDGEINIAGVSTQSTAIELGRATLEAGTYYVTNHLDVLDRSGSYAIRVYDENDTANNLAEFTEAEDGEEKSFTLTKTANVECVITISNGTQLSAVFYPMIATTSGATWDVYAEGYTEGYPQPIEATYVPYGCMRVVGVGKNLFDFNNRIATATTYYTKYEDYASINATVEGLRQLNFKDGRTLLKAGTYALSQYLTNSNDNIRIALYFFKDVEGGSAVKQINVFGNSSTSFTIDEDYYYSGAISLLASGTYQTEMRIQLEQGSEATEWQAYTEQSTILSKQFADFHNIGGITDYLTSRAEVRRFAEVVFDGSDDEVISYTANTSVPTGGYGQINLPYNAKAVSYPEVPNLLCSHFRATTNNFAWFLNGTATIGSAGRKLTLSSDAFANADDIRAMLQASPITVEYELAEDVVTMLPTADQIALHSLKSYDGVTHLYTDTYPPMVIDAEYGTSKVGAEMYEAWNMGKRAEIENAELRSLVTNLATALVAGSEG